MQSSFQPANRKNAPSNHTTGHNTTSHNTNGFTQPLRGDQDKFQRDHHQDNLWANQGDQFNPFGNALANAPNPEQPGKPPAPRPAGERPLHVPNVEPGLIQQQASAEFPTFVRPQQKADRSLAIGLNKAWRKPAENGQKEESNPFSGTHAAAENEAEPESRMFVPQQNPGQQFGLNLGQHFAQQLGPSPHFLAEA